jgi:dTMP kinase
MFIVLEGVEGAGKSLIAKLLSDELTKRGYSVLVTREPGGTEIGDVMREILLKENFQISPLTELLLFLVARADHIEKVIKPALEAERIVVCDRFFHSSIAYQGYGRGLEVGLVERLDREVRRGVVPDIVFLLDLPEEEGLKRKKRIDRLEKESLSFHKRVREGYLLLSEKQPYIKKIDATKSPHSVLQEILKILSEDALCTQNSRERKTL